jgi:hypothetical protein
MTLVVGGEIVATPVTECYATFDSLFCTPGTDSGRAVLAGTQRPPKEPPETTTLHEFRRP